MVIFLSKSELISIIGDSQGLSIQCSDGIVWVTQPNDRKDHFLGSGEEFTVNRLGTVIVEAHTDAAIIFSERIGSSGVAFSKGRYVMAPP
ncbi:MAG TPA: DUF2917 domain-containing protein [Geobacteraceae bacterium]